MNFSMPFTYQRTASFIHYDHSLSRPLYFKNEMENKNAVISKTKRLILSPAMLQSYPYLLNVKFEKSNDLVILSYQENKIVLTSCGIHIDYLVFLDASMSIALSLLRIYMLDHQSYIDISKYPHLYKNPMVYYLYKEKNYSKHFYCDNKVSWDYLNSNFFHRVILKNDCIGIHKKTYFLNQGHTKSYPHFFKTDPHATQTIFVKEEVKMHEQKFEIIEPVLFVKEVQRVKEFQCYDIDEELKDISTYGGFCIVIKDGEQIVSGACLEKFGKEYIHLSYLFTHPEFQRKGYGSQLVRALETIAFQCQKKLILLCASKKAAIFYQKNGFIKDQNCIDSDIKE